MRIIYYLILIVLFNATPLLSQNTTALKEKIGDKYFAKMSYIQAITTYEDVLKDDSGNVSVLPNLAISYRKINDYEAATRAYTKLVYIYPKDSNYLLALAQVLAVNKKYKESQSIYEQLSILCPSDTRSAAYAKAYSDSIFLSNYNKNNIITIANFNTDQSDFGPVYYKQGLVFSSGRTSKGVVKRSFDWDLSAFLDLYYIKDTGDIAFAPSIDTTFGSSKRRKLHYNDDDTRYTSNDTKTMAGYLSQKYFDTSGMFLTQPFLIEKFSKGINSKYHEGSSVFSKDQRTIYFTRNNFYNGKTKRTKDGVNKLKIYQATFDGNIWGDVKPLNINNNEYSIGHPALAANDSILIFASDMPGGYGGVDLYKSYRKENGKWSDPENMGPELNSRENDMFPYIDVEGNLFFSSDGYPGYGGLDIFKTSLEKFAPQNLGIPINSNYDDFGIALDKSGKEGFISSNRRRGFNDDDIYIVTIPKPSKFIVRIVDSATKELIIQSELQIKHSFSAEVPKFDSSSTGMFNAYLWNQQPYVFNASAFRYYSNMVAETVSLAKPLITIELAKKKTGCILAGTITNKDTKLPVPGAHIVLFDITDNDTVYDFVVGEDGKYRYASLKSQHLYLIDVSCEGFFKKPVVELNTSDNDCMSVLEREYDYLRDFELEKIVVGKAIKIENIYFDLAKYNIRKSAAFELDKIVKLMQDNPDIVIELSSHTDCRASFKYNLTLSDNRAKASADYIVSKGISSERIVGKGYGETRLVNDCECEGTVISRKCTEEEHQANRRTEFQVTGFLSDKDTQILPNENVPKTVPVPVE